MPRSSTLLLTLRRLARPGFPAEAFGTSARPAIVDKYGDHSFAQLTARANALAASLPLNASPGAVVPPRVALLCGRDVSYVIALLAIWRAGLCAVPLGLNYPPAELSYFLRQSRAELLLFSPEFADTAQELRQEFPGIRPLTEADYLADAALPEHVGLFLPFEEQPQRAAMIIYTSGTTGRPKGVLISHRNLHARVEAMRKAWGWGPEDRLINCLPLHHVHGIENCLLTPLASAATCIFLPPERFSPEGVWEQLIGPRSSANLFMAVPTMYAKLIAFHKERLQNVKNTREVCQRRFRLMVSGSAALPDPVLHEWRTLTGHTLLERYGMTELGMALTNPLRGERLPGHVGQPMSGVEVRIEGPDRTILCEGSEKNTEVFVEGEMVPGELLVRGPTVFCGYFDNDAATREAFTDDGWFHTGDTAIFDGARNAFRLLGRSSVDILKMGGYKISALEVERKLLAHEALAAVAVVGLADPTWGQKVVAAVVMAQDHSVLEVEAVREWCKSRMPPQEVPAEIRFVEGLPLNAMGKVNKKELMRLLETE